MKISRLFFSVMLSSLAAFAVSAQTDRPVDSPLRDDFAAREQRADGRNRGSIIKRVLKLSDEQMLRMRQINRTTRPKMAAAERRLKLTRKELDLAIYADELNEQDLHQKVRAVVEAQAEITRIRAMSEVAVRSVLTPEQLVRFRDLRRRFAHQREQKRLNQRRRQRRRRMRRDRNTRGHPIDNRL